MIAGARSQSASVLSSLQELKDVQDKLNEKEKQLKDTELQLANLKATAEKYAYSGRGVISLSVLEHALTSTLTSCRYRQLKQQYELKVEEEQILQAKLQQSSFHQQQEELERLRKAIGQHKSFLFFLSLHFQIQIILSLTKLYPMFTYPEESEEKLRSTKEVQKRAEEKYKMLENKMKNAEAEREKELKAAQQKLNAAKSKADAFSKKLKQKQQVKCLLISHYTDVYCSVISPLSSFL